MLNRVHIFFIFFLSLLLLLLLFWLYVAFQEMKKQYQREKCDFSRVYKAHCPDDADMLHFRGERVNSRMREKEKDREKEKKHTHRKRQKGVRVSE